MSNVRVTYRDGSHGRESFYGKTAKIVEEKKRARLLELASGGVRVNATRVDAFLEQWIETVVRPTKKPKTYRSYKSVVTNHLIPAFGTIALRSLTSAQIQAGVAGDRSDPAGARTRELAFVVLRSALNTAVRWDLIARNPAARGADGTALVVKPRVEKQEMRFYGPAEVTQLLSARGDDRLRALYSLAAFSGMREGELLGLQWQNVRLDELAVDVRQQLDSDSRTLASLKTKAARRTVDISPALAAELRDHRKRMLAEGHAHAFVFCDTDGGPLHASNFTRRSWQPLKGRAFGERDGAGPSSKAASRATVPHHLDIRFHDLRHTAATLMLAAGVHILVVSRRLGHANVKTTLDVYGHLVPLLQRNVSTEIEAFIARSADEGAAGTA